MEEWPSNWTDSRAIDFALQCYDAYEAQLFLEFFRKASIEQIRSDWPEWVDYANGVDNGPR